MSTTTTTSDTTTTTTDVSTRPTTTTSDTTTTTTDVSTTTTTSDTTTTDVSTTFTTTTSDTTTYTDMSTTTTTSDTTTGFSISPFHLPVLTARFFASPIPTLPGFASPTQQSPSFLTLLPPPPSIASTPTNPQTPLTPQPANYILFTLVPITPAPTSSPHVSLLEPISPVSFQEPTHLEELNLESSLPVPDNQTATREEPEFTIVEKGSRKGTDILISHDGYGYGMDGEMNKKGEQHWKCTVRNKTINCLASEKQNGEDFKQGPLQDVCKPRDCAIPAANIKAHIRKEGKERPFVSGSTLVKEALQQHLPSDAPASSLPAVPSLVRITNRLSSQKTSTPNQPQL